MDIGMPILGFEDPTALHETESFALVNFIARQRPAASWALVMQHQRVA